LSQGRSDHEQLLSHISSPLCHDLAAHCADLLSQRLLPSLLLERSIPKGRSAATSLVLA